MRVRWERKGVSMSCMLTSFDSTSGLSTTAAVMVVNDDDDDGEEDDDEERKKREVK